MKIAEKRLLQKTREQLAAVTAERDDAVSDLIFICKNPNMFGCMTLLKKWKEKGGEQ